MKNTANIGFRISEEKKEKLQAKADDLGITLSGLVKMIVTEYLNK